MYSWQDEDVPLVRAGKQKKHGGKPDECVVYELFLYHLIEDDKELHEIYTSCKNGKKMCGECKKHAAQLMEILLVDIKDEREKAKNRFAEACPDILAPKNGYPART